MSVTSVGCAACGSTLRVREGGTEARCVHCGAASVVLGAENTPRFLFPAAVDGDAARTTVERALGGPAVPRGLLARIRFAAPELYYVPFYELEGMVASERVEQRSPAVRPSSTLLEARRSFEDTKVLFGDFYRQGVGSALPDWGLGAVDLRRRRREGAALVPFDPGALKQAFALLAVPPPASAEVPPDVAGGRSDARIARAELLGLERRYIYYPVWRVAYRDRFHPYVFTVDGLSGEILHGRAPEDPRRGWLGLLAAEGIVALLLGKALALALTEGGIFAMLAFALSPGGWVLGSLGAFALAFPVIVMWSEARFPGEVIFAGTRREVVKLGVPDGKFEALLERTLVRFFDWLNKQIDSRRE